MKLIDLLIERQRKEEKFFKNYQFFARKIKKVAEEILGKNVQLFIFGSILKNDEVPQDIDILIISPKLEDSEKKNEIREKLWQKLGFSSPFEIHLITPEEYTGWYKHFIKEKVEL